MVVIRTTRRTKRKASGLSAAVHHSTRDVAYPGHARKMMARMKEQEHEVYYYENIEGGHGGAADNKQLAHMQALAYTFLRQQLFPATDAKAP